MRYKNFRLNGVPIKNPTTFKIERYNITNMTRLSSGLMVGDLIKKNRKFFFTYGAIDAYDLDTILDAIWETDKLYFKLEYVESGKHKEATVYAGAIPTELHNAQSRLWIWKNVNFDLIEQ